MKASKYISTKIATIGDMKKNTIEKVLDETIIVIVRGVNKEKLIPFAEALEQMPSYVSFMKDILSKKRKLED